MLGHEWCVSHVVPCSVCGVIGSWFAYIRIFLNFFGGVGFILVVRPESSELWASVMSLAVCFSGLSVSLIYVISLHRALPDLTSGYLSTCSLTPPVHPMLVLCIPCRGPSCVAGRGCQATSFHTQLKFPLLRNISFLVWIQSLPSSIPPPMFCIFRNTFTDHLVF